jgi:hypothetical protein
MSYYDDMERIAYPLVGTDDLGIPSDVLVDIQAHAPSALGTELQVLSCSVTDMVVSVVLGVTGTAIGYLTMRSEQVVVHEPYEILPILDGVSGFVVFGQGCKTSRMRVDGPYALTPSCLVSYAAPADPWTMRVGGHSVDGVVELSVGAGLKIEAQDVRLLCLDAAVRTVKAVVISAESTQTLEEPVVRCQMRADGVLGDLPVRSINGMAPSTGGNITIEVKNAVAKVGAPVITAQNSSSGLIITDPSPMCPGGGT